MRLDEVQFHKFEDRGMGYCVVFQDGSFDFDTRKMREIVLNGHNLLIRIANLRARGLPTSFEEYAYSQVAKLDGMRTFAGRIAKLIGTLTLREYVHND